MFIGQWTHNIDPKNRLLIPSRFREELGEQFVVCLPRNGEKCVFAYSLEDWKVLSQKIRESENGQSETVRSRFSSFNIDLVEMDKQGRFTMKQSFCDFAGLKKEIFILGVDNRIEFWDIEEWNAMFEKEQQRAEHCAENFTQY